MFPEIDSKKSGLTNLPQLEVPPKQVVMSNARPCTKSPLILPQIENKMPQKVFQKQQDRQSRGSRFSNHSNLSVESGSPKLNVLSIRLYDGLRLPLTSSDVLRYYQNRLTEYEQEEILDYSQIWYFGLETNKIKGSHDPSHNSGYDDEQGTYIKVLHDHIAYRYEVLELMGKGSFGQVLKCYDHKTDELVAIKVIRNKKRFHHQALVELKILDTVRKVDCDNSHNVVHMKEYFYFRNHLCITFELLGVNLYELIKSSKFQGFTIAVVQRFARSLLKCLQMLYREKIIHCDLKPENILLSQKTQGSVKVADFGSSCFEQQRVYTYIQSRFYRSPEVILGHPYGLAIDMWSLGCVLSELYIGYPLFPGESEVEQLACIMEVLGMPPDDFLLKAPRRSLFFDSKGNPRTIANSKGRKRHPNSKDLATVLMTKDPQFLDFINRCLTWDPVERITPNEAMSHKWIKEHRISRNRSKTRLVRKHAVSPNGSVDGNRHAHYKAGNNKIAEKTTGELALEALHEGRESSNTNQHSQKDIAKHLIPSETLSYELVQEPKVFGNMPNTCILRKYPSGVDNNNGHVYFKEARQKTAEKDGPDKVRGEPCQRAEKEDAAERLRPIGASAEEKTYEGVIKQASEGTSKTIHIIIKPLSEIDMDSDCQE